MLRCIKIKCGSCLGYGGSGNASYFLQCGKCSGTGHRRINPLDFVFLVLAKKLRSIFAEYGGDS